MLFNRKNNQKTRTTKEDIENQLKIKLTDSQFLALSISNAKLKRGDETPMLSVLFLLKELGVLPSEMMAEPCTDNSTNNNL